ncbi:hypothetical protein C8Q76DRAFT_851708 [Earliella scabrosa]|nr:hypothetical protein C8Q76DRAFT_851708 [Earliella scabrosa]
MLTLLECRNASPYLAALARRSLYASRQEILRRWMPDPRSFLDALRDSHGLVTGVAALAFILRDHSLLGIYLDIAVASETTWSLEMYIRTTLRGRQIWHSPPNGLHTPRWLPVERFPEETHFLVAPGRIIRVVYSRTRSAAEAIAWSENTALMNYFNVVSFGCAFPILTLRRHALSMSWRDLHPLEKRRMVHLHGRAGFTFSPVPGPFMGCAWGTYTDDNQDERYDCYADLFVCPEQGRYFGDKGSLVAFFDGEHPSNIRAARRSQQMPFGRGVVWRLQYETPGRCWRRCVGRDEVIGDGDVEACRLLVEEFNHGARFRGWRLVVDGSIPTRTVDAAWRCDWPGLLDGRSMRPGDATGLVCAHRSTSMRPRAATGLVFAHG